METVNDFLDDLAAEGVKLSVQAGELNCYAPNGALTSTLRDGIARHRTEIIRLLVDRERRPMVPRTAESIKEFALSAGQKGLYILQKVHPAMGAYNVPLGFRVRRGLDVALLAGTWDAILEQYPI